MPELPEVETVRRSLSILEGQELRQVQIADSRLRYPITAKELAPLVGARLAAINRIGKYLAFDFAEAQDRLLVVHLGMTGRLLVNAGENSYTKVEFFFARNRLTFIDVRRFGFILVGKTALNALPKGKDALAVDIDSTADKILRSRAAIKTVLMDQKIVAGIGNIYASEILFAARINPARKAAQLSRTELGQIFRATRRVLKRAIEAKGSTIADFVYALPGENQFQTGNYQKHFLVYARAGKNCRRCNAIIEKMQLGKRATFFCPRCQL